MLCRKISPALLFFLLLGLLGSSASMLAQSTIHFLPPDCPTSARCTGKSVTVTPVDTVCGLSQTVPGLGDVDAFLGIPFATADRWSHSTLLDPSWSSPLHATVYGAVCPQNAQTLSSSCFGVPDSACTVPQSEDCLSLNIWAPAGAEVGSNLPVMVYIYGGAFELGQSASALFDGARMAAANAAIVVSFNYRLGALGFMAAANAIQGTDEEISILEGNYGISDQQNALRWVNGYIANFGGDKNNVTLFGESAGAMSVGLHAISAPSSQGLFQAAIMQSNPISIPYKTPQMATKFVHKLAKELDCTGPNIYDEISCLKRVPPQTIVQIQHKVTDLDAGLAGLLVWAPVIDGTLLTREPIHGIWEDAQAPTTSVVPFILGTNRNEGRIFAEGLVEGLHHDGLNLSDFVYDLLLDEVFKKEAATKLKGGTSPYRAMGSPEKNLDQLSTLLTDYLFTCGNQYFGSTSPGDIYAYQFNQPPKSPFYLDLWPGGSPCRRQDVCHGAELDYVFDSFVPNWCQAPPADDGSLAKIMQSYWGNFSRHHTPGAGIGNLVWPQYSPGGNYLLFALDTLANTKPSTGQPIQSRADTAVDCSFLNSLVSGESWQSYDLFAPDAASLFDTLVDRASESTKSY